MLTKEKVQLFLDYQALWKSRGYNNESEFSEPASNMREEIIQELADILNMLIDADDEWVKIFCFTDGQPMAREYAPHFAGMNGGLQFTCSYKPDNEWVFNPKALKKKTK